MTDRLSPHDVAFLHLEGPTVPAQVGNLSVFQPAGAGIDHQRVRDLVADRLTLVPRFRQRIRNVPAGLARPIWVDDTSFDLAHHVRRTTLPKPGTEQQLRELVARIMSRRLHRARPLWEMHVVDGLAGGRVALLTKTHEAMVEGMTADIGQVVLDADERPRPTPAQAWQPAPEPGDLALVAGALADGVRRPTELLNSVRSGLLDLRSALSMVAAARPAPPSPLNVEVGEHRRFATVDARLDAHRAVRRTYGGTVNDVVLAAVTGALRSWMQARGWPVGPQAVMRGMLPVSVLGADGARVAPVLVDLPVGEPNPTVRLHQISYAMHASAQTGHFMGAGAMIRLSGFAPATLHALGAKAAAGFSRRRYNLVLTNVPGPQVPLYLAGARMLRSYPVVPLARGQALAIGVTSYDGGMYYGLNGDADTMPDLDLLADSVAEALAELTETAR